MSDRMFDIALASGRDMMRRLGLSSDEIDEVFDRQTVAWDQTKLIDRPIEAFDEALQSGCAAMLQLGLSEEGIAEVISQQSRAWNEKAEDDTGDDEGQTEIELWPDDDEEREDFLDRCVAELEVCIGDKAQDVCEAKWEASEKLGKKGLVTRAMVDGDLTVIEPCGKSCLACDRAPLEFRAFDESEHPRDDHGRFTDAGGGAVASNFASGTVGHAMHGGKKDQEKITHIKGSIEEVRQQAIDATIGIGDSKFETGVLISLRPSDKGVKVAVLTGDDGAVGLSKQTADQFLISEFHHNHPMPAPLSTPDIGMMNSVSGTLAVYAHTVDGGLSKATIPGRDEENPNLHWIGKVQGNKYAEGAFDGFLTSYVDFVRGRGIPEYQAILRKYPEDQADKVMAFAENYVLLKGLEANKIVEHEFKPDEWEQKILTRNKAPLNRLIRDAKLMAKEGKKALDLKLWDDYTKVPKKAVDDQRILLSAQPPSMFASKEQIDQFIARMAEFDDAGAKAWAEFALGDHKADWVQKWDESQHPRNPQGEFTDAGGGDDELGSMALGGEERNITESTRKVDALRDEMGVKDIPLDQRQALDAYTADSYTFNRQSGRKESADLDKLVGSYEIPRDMTVYRTIGWNRTQNLINSAAFSDSAFMSTTLDKSKIEKPGTYIEIHIPKGSKAFPVGSMSNYPEEAEILFPRDSKLQIISHEPREAPNTMRFVARLVS